MALPADIRAAAEEQLARFCERRVSAEAREHMRLELSTRGSSITLVERRAPWMPGDSGEWTRQPIAQLRYDDSTASWTLWWPDSSDRWHRYDDLPPARDVGPLLAEIAADPTGIFWG